MTIWASDHGRIERDGPVMHLIAEHVEDVSTLLSALTQVGVIFGSLPHEMTRMNSIHACSLQVRLSHTPDGAVGKVKIMSSSILIFRTPLSVQCSAVRDRAVKRGSPRAR